MADLADFTRIRNEGGGLCVLSTTRADGSIQSSLVTAAVLPHPVDGHEVVGLTAMGRTRKVANLRDRPPVSIVVHAGFQWVTVEGTAELAGPADEVTGLDAEGLRLLYRAVFTAAGGTHDDFDAFDRAMVDETRAVILITPTRIYSNG